MQKAAVIVLSDPKAGSEESLGRLFNALAAVYDYKQRGREVQLLFQGAGTRWAGELVNQDHPAYELFQSVKDKVAGVSCGCADVFNAQDGVAASGFDLIVENHVPNTSGLPSLARLTDEGYAVMTFQNQLAGEKLIRFSPAFSIKPMANNYLEIAFTTSVKAEQEKRGSRKQYERIETARRGVELGFAEADFIRERDGFYLATTGANDFPYVQFRGGAPGFLKVLNSKTLGFADFRGNLQYISTGNLRDNNRAALILMDYPNRQRLKIFARVEVAEAADAPELIAKLENPNYIARIERAFVLHVEAFDWNCPQHITPRFTIEELGELNQPLYARIAELEAQM